MKQYLLVLYIFIFQVSLSNERENINVSVSLNLNQTKIIKQSDSVLLHLYLDKDITNRFFFNRFKNKKILKSLFIIGNPKFQNPRYFIAQAIASEGLEIETEERSLSSRYEIIFKNTDFSIQKDSILDKVKQYSILDQSWFEISYLMYWVGGFTLFLIGMALYFYLFYLRPKRKKRKRLKEKYDARINNWEKIIQNIPEKRSLENLYSNRRDISDDLLRGQEDLRKLSFKLNEYQYQRKWDPKDLPELIELSKKLKTKAEYKSYD